MSTAKSTESTQVNNPKATSAAESAPQRMAAQASHQMEAWKDELSERWDQARQYVHDLDAQTVGQQFTGTIKKHPLKALAISFGIGAYIGHRLFRR